jgi:hypothetical protein
VDSRVRAYLDLVTNQKTGSEVTFLAQKGPVDKYGRAMYAVARSIIRAQLDQMTTEDLVDLNVDRPDVNLRQMSKFARLQRDKGMRGDGFEWAVHEAIQGGEPSVVEPIVDAMKRASGPSFKGMSSPRSLLFGYERAKYLGFLDALVTEAGHDAVLLPDGQGRPFTFGPWVTVAARGKAAEPYLRSRIKQVWKTDLFLSDEDRRRHLGTTIKSNWHALEGGRGLRLAVVPEAADLPAGLSYHKGMWVTALPDPNGFMGVFNDAYESVAEAILTLGRHDRGLYFYKPTPTGQRLREQLEGYGDVKVIDVVNALDEAAQQDLIGVEHRLVSVDAPSWLRLTEARSHVIAPKPAFVSLD